MYKHTLTLPIALCLGTMLYPSAFGATPVASTLEANNSWIYRQDVVVEGKHQGPFRPEYFIPYKNHDGDWIVAVRSANSPRPPNGAGQVVQTLGAVDGHGCIVDIPATSTLQNAPCASVLSIGDRWSIDTHQGKRRLELKVVGIEKVTVPAGTFEALQISGEERPRGATPDANIDMAVVEREMYWYASEIRAMVRIERDSIAPDGHVSVHQVELLESFASDGFAQETPPRVSGREAVVRTSDPACRPVYPEAALKAGVQGTSQIELTISDGAEVVESRVLKPSGQYRENLLLDRAAAQALAKCPVVTAGTDANGRPITTKLRLEYHWALQ